MSNLEVRNVFINDMKDFIGQQCLEMKEILSFLSWTPDQVLKNPLLVQCPFDDGHQVCESSYQQHLLVCKLQKKGLSRQQLELESQDLDFAYKNVPISGQVKIDEGLLNRIIWNHCMEHRKVHSGYHAMPVTGDDWSVELSPDERLAVYNYCTEKLKSEGKMADVEKDDVLTTDWERIVKKGLLDEGERPRSAVQLMAMMRDQKRRRQKYRARNVHTCNKSYTEIIRQVIQNQTEIMMPTLESMDSTALAEDDSAEERRSQLRHHREGSRRDRSRSSRRSRSRSHSTLERRDFDRSRCQSGSDLSRSRAHCRSNFDSSRSPPPYREVSDGDSSKDVSSSHVRKVAGHRPRSTRKRTAASGSTSAGVGEVHQGDVTADVEPLVDAQRSRSRSRSCLYEPGEVASAAEEDGVGDVKLRAARKSKKKKSKHKRHHRNKSSSHDRHRRKH